MVIETSHAAQNSLRAIATRGYSRRRLRDTITDWAFILSGVRSHADRSDRQLRHTLQNPPDPGNLRLHLAALPPAQADQRFDRKDDLLARPPLLPHPRDQASTSCAGTFPAWPPVRARAPARPGKRVARG